MKHRGLKLLSLLLTLAMVVGLMPGVGLTAYAASTYSLAPAYGQTGETYSITPNEDTLDAVKTALAAQMSLDTGTKEILLYNNEYVYEMDDDELDHLMDTMYYKVKSKPQEIVAGKTYVIGDSLYFYADKYYNSENVQKGSDIFPSFIDLSKAQEFQSFFASDYHNRWMVEINGLYFLCEEPSGHTFDSSVQPIGFKLADDSGDGSTAQNYIKFEAVYAESHNFTYEASGNTITATCTAGCPDGYNTNGITLTISAPTNLVCDGNPKTATISGYPSTAPTGLAAAPTSISYNPGDTAPTTPGTYTASFTWGGATASVSFTLTANAYAVNLSGGANATTSGGATTQSVTSGQAMTTVTYTANSGYTFPAFSNSTTNGVTLTRVSDTEVTVSGKPTANVNITVPNATAVPTFTVTYIANNGTGETKVYTPAVGQTHNVEGQLFPAPQDKEFNNWLGDDGNTYLQGAQINTNRTLTAQWKDKSQGGGSHGGNVSGADIVFNIPGVGDGWEYIGGGVPQRAWRVSFAPMQGGSAYLALNTGETGETMNVYPQTTVWVRPTTAPGYRLASIVWSMIDGSASYDITQAQNFVMPAMDVVVYVTFKPVG